MEPIKHKWVANIKGTKSSNFEISVVREDNKHGIRSYGWFDSTKILVSSGKITTSYVWDQLVHLAHDYALKLNTGELEPPYGSDDVSFDLIDALEDDVYHLNTESSYVQVVVKTLHKIFDKKDDPK